MVLQEVFMRSYTVQKLPRCFLRCCFLILLFKMGWLTRAATSVKGQVNEMRACLGFGKETGGIIRGRNQISSLKSIPCFPFFPLRIDLWSWHRSHAHHAAGSLVITSWQSSRRDDSSFSPRGPLEISNGDGRFISWPSKARLLWTWKRQILKKAGGGEDFNLISQNLSVVLLPGAQGPRTALFVPFFCWYSLSVLISGFVSLEILPQEVFFKRRYSHSRWSPTCPHHRVASQTLYWQTLQFAPELPEMMPETRAVRENSHLKASRRMIQVVRVSWNHLTGFVC